MHHQHVHFLCGLAANPVNERTAERLNEAAKCIVDLADAVVEQSQRIIALERASLNPETDMSREANIIRAIRAEADVKIEVLQKELDAQKARAVDLLSNNDALHQHIVDLENSTSAKDAVDLAEEEAEIKRLGLDEHGLPIPPAPVVEPPAEHPAPVAAPPAPAV